MKSLPLLSLFLNNRPQEMVQAPLDQKMFICAGEVLSEWAQLTPHRVEAPGALPEPGMLLLLAPLNGPRNGFFSLAATPRLGSDLAVAATGDPGASSFGVEALHELCQLLREQVLREGLCMDQRDYLLHAPQLASAEDLPNASPSASLKVLVNGQPLELRLWVV